MKKNTKMFSIVALTLFVLSMFASPVALPRSNGVVDSTASSNNPVLPGKQAQPAANPDNYTHVEWNQSIITEEWDDSFSWTNWEFGPTVTWSIRNTTTQELITIQDKIATDGWSDYIVTIPKSAIQGNSLEYVAVLGEYMNITQMNSQAPPSEHGIGFVAVYAIVADEWHVYSTKNTSMIDGPLPDSVGPEINETVLAEIFGPKLDPFMELDSIGSGFIIGAESIWVKFKLRFNASTTIGAYGFSAAALDNTLVPFAKSYDDEYDARAVGLTFDEVMFQVSGGYYDWSRYDDDGNPIYSATRGVDFNMTAEITGQNLGNVTVLIDLPYLVQGQELVDGPFSVTELQIGGWEYDNISMTYFWNETLAINYTETRWGLHWEDTYIWYENGYEYSYDEPIWNTELQIWDMIPSIGWAKTQQAIVYWFGNDSFDIRLAYSEGYYEFRPDPMSQEGGWWEFRDHTIYYPWPADNSIPQPYILNSTGSSHMIDAGRDVVTFRGSISEAMLQTKVPDNPPLEVREQILTSDGKRLESATYMPFASESDRVEYESLRTLSIESPVAAVQLYHEGEPYDPSWMFITNREETFTVKSRLQGGAEYASDIDGVALVLRATEYDWGFNETTGSDWSQWSEVEIWIKINPEGEAEITVYNFTERTAWEYGGSWEWVEIYSGVWDQVWVENQWRWTSLIWDFVMNDWSEEWIRYQGPETIMSVNYVNVGNLTYDTIGNDLRVLFDVTPTIDMPEFEWQWDYYYANLTFVADYESGWGEHTTVGWIKEPVYSYLNGTDQVYAERPTRGSVMRNNDTGELYAVETFPFIVIDGEELSVKKLIESDITGMTWETILYEEWDPDAYDPMTGMYSGNWVYSYYLTNDTQIPIQTGVSADVYNVTLFDGITNFESFENEIHHAYWLPGNIYYMYLLNGTFLFNSTFPWQGTTLEHLGSTPGTEIGLYVMVNHTIPLLLEIEPIWTGDHYILVLNGTSEEIHAWWEYNIVLDQWFYAYFNGTDGLWYWLFDDVFASKVYEIDWTGSKYHALEEITTFSAFTEIRGVRDPLPYYGASVYSVWDLDPMTPRKEKVEINGIWYPVEYIGDYYDNILTYPYPGFVANVSNTFYNLTRLGLDPMQPWNPDPYDPQTQPWTTVANGSIYIPMIEHHDWTVAYGYRNPFTWEFEVEGFFDLVSGKYTGEYTTSQIFEYNVTGDYDYVITSTGEKLNYTQRQRSFMYNVTFPNGTYFYSGHQWIEEKTVDLGGYYEVQYYYMYDINGTEVRWYDWLEVTIELVKPDEYNGMTQQFLINGSWYNITQFDYWTYDIDGSSSSYLEWTVEIDWFWALVNSTGGVFEVVSLDEDMEGRYNLPSFNFTMDADYNLTGSMDLIYKAYTTWGYGQKYDYVPLPISIIREQWSIIIGVPEWGMWDLNSWEVNPSNGAIDLDGNLETTDDQYYIKSSFESTDSYNLTESYLWVSIMWEPNSTIFGDEFYIESYMGMQSVNWTNTWADNYYWYNAETGSLVNATEWNTINATLYNEYGFPNPGYWDLAWMGHNFTSDDLKQQAIDEGWDWAIEDSQTWSWIWWDMREHYGTEFQNNTETEYVSVDVWYEYAGMFAWNDTNQNDIMDYTTAGDSEATHYWIPHDVNSISFITPNASASGDEFWDVNATVPFGVSFSQVNGTVFPFGDYSYFDWYQGQYVGSDFLNFADRPTEATTKEFSIGVTFTGTINETGNNVGEVKFNVTVGDWDLDTPGGRSELDGRSLGVAFYSDVTMYSDTGVLLGTQYYDDNGVPISNNASASSQNYTMAYGAAEIASMNLGGASYTWSKNASADYTILDSQTVPVGAFTAAYSSSEGGTATSFTISEDQFYTLLNFKWWDGYAVSVDPVFVGYSSSQGIDDQEDPSLDEVDTSVVFVDDKERLYFEVEASDSGGSGVATVVVMNTTSSANTTLQYNGDTNTWTGYVEMVGTTPFAFDYMIVVSDYASNEANNGTDQHYFWNDPEVPNVTNVGTTGAPDDSYVTISATATDTGGSDIDHVDLYNVNTEETLTMTYNSGASKYEVDVMRSSGWEFELTYRVTAYDNAGNYFASSELSYNFKDAIDPVITSVTGTNTTDDLLVQAEVSEQGGSGLTSVEITYTISGTPTTVDMTFNSGNQKWEYTISDLSYGTWVYYTITATDGEGNTGSSSEEAYFYSDGSDAPPGIGTFTIDPSAPEATDVVTISVRIDDDHDVKNATLYYKVDTGDWTYVVMSEGTGNIWSADIPAQVDGSVVTFYVITYDNIDQMSQSSEQVYTIGVDATNPSISSVSLDISHPTSSDIVTVSATVTDDSALQNVTLYYQVDGGSWIQVVMSATGDIYSGTIPAQADGSVVTYYIRAYDTSGNYVDSAQQSYTVQDSTETTTPTTTPTTGPTTTIPPVDTELLILIGGGVGILVVVILISVIVKKRR